MNLLGKVVRVIKNPKKIYYRLLQRSFLKKQDKLFEKNFIRNREKANSIILASFQKSGNTFFRFVWMNIINLKELNIDEIDFKILDEHLPFDGFFSDIKKEWKFKSLPCLLKTHYFYSDKFKTFKKIHLFRNPLDTMVSNYHYSSKRTKGPGSENLSKLEKKYFNIPTLQFKGSFIEFIKDDFIRYCEHFKSWMESEAIPASYETLISENSVRYLREIFEKLGIQIEEELLKRAIELSGKDKLKGKVSSEMMAKLDGMHFIRDGSIGQWRDYFKEREFEYILEKLSFYGLDKMESFPREYRELLVNWPSEKFLSELKAND